MSKAKKKTAKTIVEEAVQPVEAGNDEEVVQPAEAGNGEVVMDGAGKSPDVEEDLKVVGQEENVTTDGAPVEDRPSAEGLDADGVLAAFGQSVGTGTNMTQPPVAPGHTRARKIKVVLLCVVGLLAIAGVVAFAFWNQEATARKEKAALRSEQILEATNVTKTLVEYQKLYKAEDRIITQLGNVAAVNNNQLAQWGSEWTKRQKRYDAATAAVTTYNQNEDDKHDNSEVTDMWGYSLGYTYEVNYKDYPAYPNMPKKVKVVLTPQIRSLAKLKDSVDVKSAELAKNQSVHFSNVHEQAIAYLDAVRESTQEINTVLDEGVVSAGDKGKKVDADKIAALSSSKSKALFKDMMALFESDLATYGIKPEEAGLQSAEE